MKTNQYEDLMQQVLDGLATPEEEARLEAALAGDASLRGRYQELQRLFAMLESVGEVEPPPGALEEALQQVRQIGANRPQGQHTLGRGWLGAGWEALRQRFTPQLAYAFTTGTIAGIALFAVFEGQVPSKIDGNTPGTVVSRHRFDTAHPLDRVELQANGFQGVLSTSMVDGTLLGELECSSSAAAAIFLEWDFSAEPLLGFDQSSPLGRIAVEPKGLRIEHQGENRYRIWFGAPRQQGAQLRIRVDVGGTTLKRAVRAVPEDL